MKNFVLVPGGWMGAWAWEKITWRLQELGHEAYPVTLTGLDDPEGDHSGIGVETHINDVLGLLEEKDLKDVVLVGHGTSGVIVEVVAERADARVDRVVLLEGNLAHDGKSTLDAFPEGLRADEIRLITENGGRWPVPDISVVADGQDLTEDQASWLVKHFVPHPGRPLLEPVTLKRPLSMQPTTYIVCEKEHFDGRLRDDVDVMRTVPNWTFRTLDTGFWAMVSAPDELVTLLGEAADA